jgi:hypothetical protein
MSLAEKAEIGYYNARFLQPEEFMMSNYRDALCCFQPCSPQTSVQPSINELCRTAWFANEQHQREIHPNAGIKAMRGFETRLQYLDALNEKLSTLAQDSLPRSGLSALLSTRLKQNKFFPSICNVLLTKRKQSRPISGDYAHTDKITSETTMDAEKRHARLASLEGTLQALEVHTHRSLISMLRIISDEIPLQLEDIHSIIGNNNKAFAAAKSALTLAIDEKANSSIPRSTLEISTLSLLSSTCPKITFPSQCPSIALTAKTLGSCVLGCFRRARQRRRHPPRRTIWIHPEKESPRGLRAAACGCPFARNHPARLARNHPHAPRPMNRRRRCRCHSVVT